MEGFIKIHRSFFSNLWTEARTFSVCEAWIDLIQLARFDATPRKVCIGGREVVYGRGQYPASIRYLSKKWGRSDRWVRTTLDKFKKEGMVTIDNSQGISIITLVNFDKYNGADDDGGTAFDTAFDTPTALAHNGLQAEAAQPLTQPLTHPPAQPPEKRHGGDTNTKKGEEGIDSIDYGIQDKESFPDGKPKKAALSLPAPGEKIDYEALMGVYNRTLSGRLPQIRYMTDARRAAVKARIAQYGKQAVMEAFRLVAASTFLTGGNPRGWKADFDWIFKQQNFTKILEGIYNDNDRKPPGSTAAPGTRRESVSRLKDLAERILQGAPPPDD